MIPSLNVMSSFHYHGILSHFLFVLFVWRINRRFQCTLLWWIIDREQRQLSENCGNSFWSDWEDIVSLWRIGRKFGKEVGRCQIFHGFQVLRGEGRNRSWQCQGKVFQFFSMSSHLWCSLRQVLLHSDHFDEFSLEPSIRVVCYSVFNFDKSSWILIPNLYESCSSHYPIPLDSFLSCFRSCFWHDTHLLSYHFYDIWFRWIIYSFSIFSK